MGVPQPDRGASCFSSPWSAHATATRSSRLGTPPLLTLFKTRSIPSDQPSVSTCSDDGLGSLGSWVGTKDQSSLLCLNELLSSRRDLTLTTSLHQRCSNGELGFGMCSAMVRTSLPMAFRPVLMVYLGNEMGPPFHGLCDRSTPGHLGSSQGKVVPYGIHLLPFPGFSSFPCRLSCPRPFHLPIPRVIFLIGLSHLASLE